MFRAFREGSSTGPCLIEVGGYDSRLSIRLATDYKCILEFRVLIKLCFVIDSYRRSASKPSIESCIKEFLSSIPGPQDPPFHQGHPRCSLAYSSCQQFSFDVIDIAFAMSR